MYFLTSENRDILIIWKSPKEKLNFILHVLWNTFDTHKIKPVFIMIHVYNLMEPLQATKLVREKPT